MPHLYPTYTTSSSTVWTTTSSDPYPRPIPEPTMPLQRPDPADAKSTRLFDAVIEENKARAPHGLMNTRNHSLACQYVQSTLTWEMFPSPNDWITALHYVLAHALGSYHMDIAGSHFRQYSKTFNLRKAPPLHIYAQPGRFYLSHMQKQLQTDLQVFNFIREYLLTTCQWSELGTDYSILAYATAVFTQLMGLPRDTTRYMPPAVALLKGDLHAR